MLMENEQEVREKLVLTEFFYVLL